MEDTKTKHHKRLIPKAHPISWVMLIITTLAILMNSIDRQLLPTVMPAIMKEFGLNNTQAGFLNSLSFLGILIGAVFFGFISDHIGNGYKRAYSWYIATMFAIVGAFLSAFAYSFRLFQALRIFMGLGSGGGEPLNVALVGEWWQKENRGFALGVHHTGFPLGQFIGPVLIGLVIAYTANWRYVFLLIPLIGLGIIILQLFVATPKKQKKVYDWIKENNLTIPIDEQIKEKKSFLETLKQGFLCLKNKNCLMAVFLFFIFSWVEFGIATFLTIDLTKHVGLSLDKAILISGASGITGWIGQIVWGHFSDLSSRKKSLYFILTGWIVSTFMITFIHSELSGWIILIFWGLFRNSPYPVIYAYLLDTVPETASSSLGLMIGIGFGLAGLLVSPTAGWIIDSYGFNTHYAFMIFSLLIAIFPLWKMVEKKIVH